MIIVNTVFTVNWNFQNTFSANNIIDIFNSYISYYTAKQSVSQHFRITMKQNRKFLESNQQFSHYFKLEVQTAESLVNCVQSTSGNWSLERCNTEHWDRETVFRRHTTDTLEASLDTFHKLLSQPVGREAGYCMALYDVTAWYCMILLHGTIRSHRMALYDLTAW